MKKYVVFLLIFFGVSVLISSCKKESGEITITNQWRFIGLEQGKEPRNGLDSIPEDLRISVLFDPLTIVEVESYCNNGSGNYQTRSADLEIINLSMTEKYCSIDEPIDWEAVFVYNFKLAEYYLIEEEKLIILTGGDYHLHFKIDR
jgi:heat shock protein HslJ